MKKLLAFIFSFVLALSAVACSSRNSDSNSTVDTTAAATIGEDMKERMDKALKRNYFEGIVCLTQNGSVIYQSATGKDEKDEDLTVDTTMYIGSVSKQFCAAAIMMLRDQGKLSVDDTLDKYFPEYSNGKDITLKNLLSMRSGIPNMVSEGKVDGISSDKTEAENVALIKEWIFSQPLLFEPDSSLSYSNSNYFLLGNIVEQVSGQAYSDFIRKNIFEPLGMTHSGFVDEVRDSPEWAGNLTYDTFMSEDA
ncbi:MAG: serine hydrolase, partial [Ruminococcus sp.]